MIWIDLPEIGVVDGARIAGLRRGRQSSPSRGRVGVAESRAAADPFYFLPFFFPVSVDFSFLLTVLPSPASITGGRMMVGRWPSN